MVSVGKLKQVLPPLDGQRTLIVSTQKVKHIVDGVLHTHGEHVKDYDLIYHYFDTGDAYSTCRKLWEFCKYNMQYQAESEDFQSIRSPAAILSNTVDCKHYSLFIGGVLDAIKENENEPWDWCYRFVSYTNDKNYGHVFVVVTEDNGNEIWIDPVMYSFDNRKSFYYKLDKYHKEMALYKVSGVDQLIVQTAVTVDAKQAERDFLIMVNQNMFSLKDLLKTNPSVLYNEVKPYFLSHGFNFDFLVNLLQY